MVDQASGMVGVPSSSEEFKGPWTRSGQGPQNSPEALPVTTGSCDLDGAGDALKSMLEDEPT